MCRILEMKRNINSIQSAIQHGCGFYDLCLSSKLILTYQLDPLSGYNLCKNSDVFVQNKYGSQRKVEHLPINIILKVMFDIIWLDLKLTWHVLVITINHHLHHQYYNFRDSYTHMARTNVNTNRNAATRKAVPLKKYTVLEYIRLKKTPPRNWPNCWLNASPANKAPAQWSWWRRWIGSW